MICVPPKPNASAALRLGLVPSTKISKDKLEGNAPPAETKGEGSGVIALDGICNVEPLGVRIGEEQWDPFGELRDLVLATRANGVDVPGRLSVRIRSKWSSSDVGEETSPIARIINYQRRIVKYIDIMYRSDGYLTGRRKQNTG